MTPSILVTAGPTREQIDPIRFISNYSTGRFGYEIARAARRRGHRVVLVSGPTHLKAPAGVRRVSVESALEMKRAVEREFKSCGVVIMAAAVSDYTPVEKSKVKTKKEKGLLTLKLEPTEDILA